MDWWMIRQLGREMRPVFRELGGLGVALLPWLPGFVLAVLGLDRFDWRVVPVIVLLTPVYRWLLRGGPFPLAKIKAVVCWALLAGLTWWLPVSVPPVVLGPALVLVALVVNQRMN